MPPFSAIVMLAGIMYGGMYGGTLTSVLVNVPADARMAHEEIFGPVAPLSTFGTEAEAIERAFGK